MMLATVLTAVAYVAGWATIPMLDRMSIASGVQLPALSATTLPIGALVTATYLLIFTDAPGDALGVSTHCPTVLISGATLGAVTLVYFRLLSSGGMMAVVLMQPALLIVQTTLAAAVLKEPVDPWKIAGVAVAAASMLIANGGAILGRIRNLA